jgi:DNA invertase Pin-like site-specific DNA recombinase
MIFGYVRLINNDKITQEMQIESLSKRCDKVIIEDIGHKSQRKEFSQLTKYLKKGDILIVYDLNRINLTTLQFLRLLSDFIDKQIGFISITDNKFNTTGENAGIVTNILKSLYYQHKKIRKEHIYFGIEQANKRGMKGGRKFGLSKENAKKAYKALKLHGTIPIDELLQKTGISNKSTLYRYIKFARDSAFNKE